MTAEPTVRLRNEVYVPPIATTPMFRWSGEYFGFVQNNALFAADGTYIAWIEGNTVWKKDGTFCGQVVEQNYVLKRHMKLDPLARMPRTPPGPPITPIPWSKRPARVLESDSVDALGAFDRALQPIRES